MPNSYRNGTTKVSLKKAFLFIFTIGSQYNIKKKKKTQIIKQEEEILERKKKAETLDSNKLS